MHNENTTNKPLSRKEKCLATCALLFTSFAFIHHSTMVSILATLFILSIVIIKQQKISLDKPTKLLIFSFVLLFVFSMPNMIMDSLYVGKIKASSLDVPSRYLLGAIVLIGLSQLRLKAEHLFIGNMIGIATAFALYPVWGDFILNNFRYAHQHSYEHILVGVLAVAYMAIPCMLTALISTIYFYKRGNKALTVLAIICANLASVVMVLSGSKVVLICYPLIPLLLLFTWRKTSSDIRWLMITPLITAIAFLLGKEYFAWFNIIFTIPLILTYISSENKRLRRITFFNIAALITFIAVTVALISYSQTDNGQKSIQKLTTNSVMLNRVNDELNTMDKVNSATLRIAMWKSAWASFKESPLLGQGYEQRKVFHNQFIIDEKLPKELITQKGKGSLHNEIMNALGKKGIVGLVAMLVLYLVPIYLFTRLQKTSNSNYYVGFSGVFLILSFMLAGITESLLMTTFMSSFFVISIILTYLALQRTPPAGQSEQA